jgi:hypothetical protein
MQFTDQILMKMLQLKVHSILLEESSFNKEFI